MDEVTSVTINVEVRASRHGIQVWTDGSRMGTYRSWGKVGTELADEFKYRVEQQKEEKPDDMFASQDTRSA